MPDERNERNKEETEAGQPVQSEEAREAALRAAPRGLNTATGIAYEHHFGEKETPEGEERGSTRESAGHADEIKPDAVSEGQGPVGLQAEEAAYARNGTIPAGFTASPSGPVPISSVARDPEEAKRRASETFEAYDKQLIRSKEYEELSDEQIDRASGAELRAVAHDRGYNLGPIGGNRSTRARFRRAQAEDRGSSSGESAETREDRLEVGTGSGNQE